MTDSMRSKQALLFLALVALYAIDPYSRGEAGELAVFSGRTWQILVTACLATLLIIGGVFARRGKPGARNVALLETAGFVLLNLVYVVRDGPTRFWFGYEHEPIGYIVVIGGTVLRLILLGSFARSRSEVG